MRQGRFELKLVPDWDTVKASWDDCHRFLSEHGLDGDQAYALSMTAQELLENAVKYGGFTNPAQRVELYISLDERDVIIEVKAPAHGDPARLKKLDDTIQWIRGYQSPFEAYVEKLKQVSAQPYAPGESGLGLARVAYEGQCVLDFYVDETDVLAMSAVHHLV
ncbi:MAG TPA: ATP-binding protein [Myxococcales bacterium]|nr:ATP-binding protein [Myxococcales bacterium]